MARKKNQVRLDNISKAIQKSPDQFAGWYGSQLGIDNKTIMRALPQLEERGDLLAEDASGRLRWFGKRKF